MMIKKISGCHAVSGLVGISACLFFCNTASAWQQEYIVSDAQSNTAERYTWDADHQPRYEEILAERMKSSQNMPGFALNLPSGSSAEDGMSVGWNFPVSGHVTTGPVMGWRYDGSAPMMINEFGDGVTTQASTDPLWHASVSTLGWRVDTQYGDLHPWAQISVNQQFGVNQWKSQFGMPQTPAPAQNGSWVDVTVGTDIPLNTHMAAYASLAQGEGTATGEQFMYSLGVSANF
ncbi:autotransporter domain-containing protein [Enterobacter cloacae complex sp. 2024EL-00215]|uniref:Autotransporter domain-containing protein n=1 Tax=Enterobacter mori TaxID=539813 RepID=A0A7T0H167_9ENTR|nr:MULTISPECIES: autotransporter domain-containing protein [Enterobacter]MBA7855859.1 autotransporter domain-containing protein [Enterobacter sp. RHBSTW-00901]QPK00746.1 autotransporter domain-containing protein [Enterobacter mori]BBS35326.1 outer membrane autotransporter barrel domain-containing protein [Enterobacter cloacae]